MTMNKQIVVDACKGNTMNKYKEQQEHSKLISKWEEIYKEVAKKQLMLIKNLAYGIVWKVQ